ncbi:signal recognition particle-docking protein FtsY [Fructilactobacillus florum]|uniref:Signal recognition particle receptor FtsY n=1 Tax=Fructilactobacillus florum DSM 22689 = JCM 16035 TaxID=1423745 RepID=A0A0R2CKM5_9LACO|nr:signal recognition particle-docking protein FtsY [Fructilactobacillus florum]KRM91776.1 signal recognition particle-docking protein FtsY [Fructilactobacillus florum DSM 22689 = JCM 16035]
MGLFDIFKKKNSTVTQQDQPVEADSKSQGTPVSSESEADSVSTTKSTSTEVTAPAESGSKTAAQSSEKLSSATSQSTFGSQSSQTTSQSTSESSSVVESQSESKPKTTEKTYEHGLSKSRSAFGQQLNRLFASFRSVDESFFDDLEDTLIQADVGVKMSTQISDELRDAVKLNNLKQPAAVQNFIVEKLIEMYDDSTAGQQELTLNPDGPTVILLIGVNGAGKTTTIGKLANQYRVAGKKVLVAAADTFRAGAIEQLDEWARRDQVDIVKKPEGSDPASVVYDAVERAKREHYDILFVDTAGRLQNKVNLMNELAKMNKIIQREIPTAPQEVLLVIDATIGQNALSQAEQFQGVAKITGIVLTKLDGTARGGIILAIKSELGIPVKYVGLGEGVSDLQPFDPQEFVDGLFKGLLKEPTHE